MIQNHPRYPPEKRWSAYVKTVSARGTKTRVSCNANNGRYPDWVRREAVLKQSADIASTRKHAPVNALIGDLHACAA